MVSIDKLCYFGKEQRKHGERGGEIESRRRRFHEVEKKSFGIRCEGIKGWVVCLCFVVEEKKGGWVGAVLDFSHREKLRCCLLLGF